MGDGVEPELFGSYQNKILKLIYEISLFSPPKSAKQSLQEIKQ
jgi:hypothetical protein